MRTNNLYKHVYNTDVAIYPLKIIKITNDRIKIKCRWINIVNPNNQYDIGVIDNVIVNIKDLKNWKVYE